MRIGQLRCHGHVESEIRAVDLTIEIHVCAENGTHEHHVCGSIHMRTHTQYVVSHAFTRVLWKRVNGCIH